MSAFVEATTLVPLEKGVFGVTLDASWLQGRGVYGGLGAAILARALEAEAPKGQRLVRLTAAFTAPLSAGPARAAVETIRTGRNVSMLRASLFSESGGDPAVPAVTCLATLARPRSVGALVHHGLGMPTVPPPDAVPDGPEEHYFPTFARHFSFRQCLGPRPFSGGAEARVGGYCRLNEPAPLDVAVVTALLDAWPPAAVGRSPSWCSVASLEMSVHFLVPLSPLSPASGSEWLFYDATCDHVEGGLADERAVIFDGNGAPLATCHQLIALMPPSARD